MKYDSYANDMDFPYSYGIGRATFCEAVGRPTMRFVPVKSEKQAAVLITDFHRPINRHIEP